MIRVGDTFYDGDLSTPVQDGPTRKLFPNMELGDYTTFAIERDYHVRMSLYQPLALDTPDDEFGTCFLVEETQPEILGGEVAKFTRTFSQIPAPLNIWEPYLYEFPGIGGSSPVPVTATANLPLAAETGQVVFDTESPSSFSVGMLVQVKYRYRTFFRDTAGEERSEYVAVAYGRVTAVSDSSVQAVFSGNFSALQGPLGTQIDPNRNIPVTTPFEITLLGGFANRLPISKLVNSRKSFEYFLSPTPAQIQMFQAFEVRLSSGVIITQDFDGYLSTSTTPTFEEYNEMMQKGTEICPDNSVLRKWWGNIYERCTRFVVAE